MTRRLEGITTDHMGFLYNLLQERTPDMSISHKEMPTFEEHCTFWASKPYYDAYIILDGNHQVGMCYLTANFEVGIFIKKTVKRRGLGLFAWETIKDMYPKKRMLANINPKNKDSIDFFKMMGFKHIQNTYELVTR